MTMTGKSEAGNVEYSGSGASIGVAGGYALTPQLIVFGQLLYAGTSGTDVKMNGGNSTSTTYDVNVAGIGLGAASYFGPNLFVSASVLLATATIDDSSGHTVVSSKSGFGFDAIVGKEWWVSDNWGLGVSGQMILGRMKGKDPDLVLVGTVPDWSTLGFALLFSATYN